MPQNWLNIRLIIQVKGLLCIRIEPQKRHVAWNKKYFFQKVPKIEELNLQAIYLVMYRMKRWNSTLALLSSPESSLLLRNDSFHCAASFLENCNLLTWDTFWYARPGPVFANRGRVVRLLELVQTSDVDGVGVGHTRAGGAVGNEPMGYVWHNTRSCKENSFQKTSFSG